MSFEILRALGLILTGSAAIACLIVAAKILGANKIEYALNQERTPGFLPAVRGELKTVFDGSRDYRVASGLVVDLGERNKWKEQGRLSEEAVSGIFRRPRERS